MIEWNKGLVSFELRQEKEPESLALWKIWWDNDSGIRDEKKITTINKTDLVKKPLAPGSAALKFQIIKGELKIFKKKRGTGRQRRKASWLQLKEPTN